MFFKEEIIQPLKSGGVGIILNDEILADKHE